MIQQGRVSYLNFLMRQPITSSFLNFPKTKRRISSAFFTIQPTSSPLDFLMLKTTIFSLVSSPVIKHSSLSLLTFPLYNQQNSHLFLQDTVSTSLAPGHSYCAPNRVFTFSTECMELLRSVISPYTQTMPCWSKWFFFSNFTFPSNLCFMEEWMTTMMKNTFTRFFIFFYFWLVQNSSSLIADCYM